MSKALLGTLVVLSSLLFVVWWPLATIWCVNTLFRTDIPMNIQTWTATVVLVVTARFVFSLPLGGSSKKP